MRRLMWFFAGRSCHKAYVNVDKYLSYLKEVFTCFNFTISICLVLWLRWCTDTWRCWMRFSVAWGWKSHCRWSRKFWTDRWTRVERTLADGFCWCCRSWVSRTFLSWWISLCRWHGLYSWRCCISICKPSNE